MADPLPDNAVLPQDLEEPKVSWSTGVLDSFVQPRARDAIDEAAIEEIKPQPGAEHGGVALSAVSDRERAIKLCKEEIERLARDCRQRNSRFRDEDFDIRSEPSFCLDGLIDRSDHNPAVARVHKIFEKPSLFKDGIKADDLRQGKLGNCWFISSLATIANTKPVLLEELCVAKDEEVGIYGFLFFRDGGWRTTVIDDQLFITNKPYNELSTEEKDRWKDDRKLYEDVNLKGSRSLYFASGTDLDQTWVPLYEKAYAKAHGDYQSVVGGLAGEGVEDLTGGVSTIISVADILDTEKFWHEELMRVQDDRLISCYVAPRLQTGDLNGLISNHSYSILKTIEVKGERFLLIRCPWGKTGGDWTGAWSNGSEQWTVEWMQTIGHTFGDHGRFIMNYKDFLQVWTGIEHCRLFDSSWSITSHYVEVKTRPWPAASAFGDVSFTVTLTQSSSTVLVLARQDDRYFKGLEGYLHWGLEFRVFEYGKDGYIGRSPKSSVNQRSVKVELDLEPGEYVVHVRLHRQPMSSRSRQYLQTQDISIKKLASVFARLMESKRKASNFDSTEAPANFLSPPTSFFQGKPLEGVKQSAKSGEPQMEPSKDDKTADPMEGPKTDSTEPEKKKSAGEAAADKEAARIQKEKEELESATLRPDRLVISLRVYSHDLQSKVDAHIRL